MSLAGSSRKRKDVLFSGLEYRTEMEGDDTDDEEDNITIALNRKTTVTITQTFPAVTIPTALPQTFPTVTIPTALTSSTSFSEQKTVTLGPTSVLISFFFITLTGVPVSSSVSVDLIIDIAFPVNDTLYQRSIDLHKFLLYIGDNSCSTAAGDTNGSSSTSKLRLSPGAIAGVTIAVLVILLILALLLFFLLKQFRDRRRGSSGGLSDSLYEKQLISPISSPYDRRGTAFTPMLQAPRPAYPSDRASSEIFVGGGGRGG
ncbi:hypothetical protein L207DRAFT_575570 [Hyaloscypha variabilis F]|uniref:Uncharacterized protein n=1 Tax=Hyaloscypha variabilis (strain UAMH 11265 / GT02V1 / F) TaxID=1149755 RepID=A0A2J6SDT3_HYAVF|nr:hypothetical protein L207DRAFT_575570 [Hyaloscypha variabilis F]